jgi:hypothetical protein
VMMALETYCSKDGSGCACAVSSTVGIQIG